MALIALLFCTLTFNACKKDPDATTQENITTISLHLSCNGFDQTFTWQDLDGAGGNAPQIEEIKIPVDKELSCEITVLDKSKTPVVDLTEEIEAEDAAHLFTFGLTGANATIEYDDKDDNGKNVGLKTKWKTIATSSGSLKLRLYHEPTDKSNTANPGGEIDVEVDFPVAVF